MEFLPIEPICFSVMSSPTASDKTPVASVAAEERSHVDLSADNPLQMPKAQAIQKQKPKDKQKAPETNSVECPRCQQTFKSKGLHVHLRYCKAPLTVTSKEPTLVTPIDVEGQVVVSSSNVCDACKKTFTTAYSLKRHSSKFCHGPSKSILAGGGSKKVVDNAKVSSFPSTATKGSRHGKMQRPDKIRCSEKVQRRDDFAKSRSSFAASSSMRIGTWNVRTMAKPGKAVMVVKQMQKFGVEICGLTEVRWPGSGESNTDGYKFLHSGRSDSLRFEGVALLLSPAVARSVMFWKPISERLLLARLSGRHANVSIIVAYAPTEEAEACVKDEFYNKLNALFGEIPGHDRKILLGDFNASLGPESRNMDGVTGSHVWGRRTSDNGERLIECALTSGMMIGNTHFGHKKIHALTWMPPDVTKQGAVKDYILVDKGSRSSMHDVRVFRSADADSDHFLLVMNYKLSLSAVPRKRGMTSLKPVAAILSDEKVAQPFQASLSKKLLSVPVEHDVDAQWESMANALQQAAREVAASLPRVARAEWISAGSFTLLDQKQQAFSRWQSNRSDRRLREEYVKLRRAAGKSIRHDRKRWWSEQADLMEADAARHHQGAVYSRLRKLCRSPGVQVAVLKSVDGKDLVTPDEQRERWREHFEMTLNVDHGSVDQSIFDDLSSSLERLRFAPVPTKEEVKACVSRLKNGKACGKDGIFAEMLKYGGDSLHDRLYEIIQCIWKNEVVPKVWRDSVVIPLFKKGDRRVCDNFRPISLLAVTGKVLASLLDKQIREVVEKQFDEGQCGFRPCRGTVDQVFVARQLLEKAVEFSLPLPSCFVDLTKAFDSVHRPIIWHLLRRYGVAENIVRIVEDLYRGSEAEVRHGGDLSSSFEVRTGVKQGCVLSPLLFILFMDAVLKDAYGESTFSPVRMEYDSQGRVLSAEWRGKRDGAFHVTWLAYADDLLVTAINNQGLEDAMTQLDKTMTRWGMKISPKKSKVLVLGNHGEGTKPKVTVQNEKLAVVRDFAYLGSILTEDGSLDPEVDSRLTKASKAFEGLRRTVWRRKELSTKTKVRIYQASVLSTLMYGSETWAPTKTHIKRLETFHQRCLRNLVRVRWFDHVTNEEVLRRADMGSVEGMIRKRRLQWVGHVFRMEPERHPRLMLGARPLGASRQFHGGKRRFADVVRQDFALLGIGETAALKLTQDREKWSRLVHKAATARQS